MIVHCLSSVIHNFNHSSGSDIYKIWSCIWQRGSHTLQIIADNHCIALVPRQNCPHLRAEILQPHIPVRRFLFRLVSPILNPTFSLKLNTCTYMCYCFCCSGSSQVYFTSSAQEISRIPFINLPKCDRNYHIHICGFAWILNSYRHLSVKVLKALLFPRADHTTRNLEEMKNVLHPPWEV